MLKPVVRHHPRCRAPTLHKKEVKAVLSNIPNSQRSSKTAKYSSITKLEALVESRVALESNTYRLLAVKVLDPLLSIKLA